MIPKPQRTIRYFLPLGLLAGLSVVAFAALPLGMGGLVSFVGVVLGGVLDRLTRPRDWVPKGAPANWHLTIAGGAYIGALALAITVARGNSLWLSGISATIVLALFVAGSWVLRPSDAT